MNGFSPTSARTVSSGPFGSASVVQTSALQNVPSVANTALAKLDASALAEVRKLKDQLVKIDPTSLAAYGDGVQDEIASMADKLMQHTRSADLDFVGSKLTDIIVHAKGINVEGMSGKCKVPLIGGIIDKFRVTKERVIGQFDTASGQVEKIVDEVDKFTVKLHTSLATMGDLYAANQRQYMALDQLVIAAHMALEELRKETDAFVAQLGPNPDPFDVQQVADARNYITSLEMKASNLEKLKHQAYMAAPAIRLMQQNGINMIEQFKLVKSQVVPGWKRNFMIAIMVDEQAKGVALNDKIADASNQMAMQTATMLKQTTVAVAKANQRGVLDMSTIEHVQNELISGVTEVIKITEEGAKQRQAASQRIGEMQKELQLKLTQRK